MILLLAVLLIVFAAIEEPWTIVILAVACVLEVGEIMFLRRWAKRLDRRTPKTTGAEAMIGAQGEVVERCRPKGMVHVNGELWNARCSDGADEGDTVRVESVQGLTLIVDRVG